MFASDYNLLEKRKFEWEIMDTIALGGVMQKKKQQERMLTKSYRSHEQDNELRFLRSELKVLKRILKNRQLPLKMMF